MTILENLINELTTEKNNGVESYLFAIQYTNDIISVVEMAIAEIAKNIDMFTVSNKNGNAQLKFKATKQVKEILKKYETVATFKTETVEKMNAQSDKINRGHCIEMLLFGYTENEVLKSQSKIDGVFNGKNVQVKQYFTVYNSWADSINAHTLLIVNGTADNHARFHGVQTAKTYQQAAYELQRNGYATDPDYASKLIYAIKKFNLAQYDNVK